MGSTYGALKLADGGRVPWLTIRSEAAAWMPGDVRPLAAKEWIAHASAWMDQQASLIEGGRHHRREPMRGDVWMSMPCTQEEALWVVVSGAFFDTDAYHAVALRAGRVLHETFPTTSDRSAVFVRAIELTKKVLGTDSLEIAPHTVEDTTRPSVHDDTWGSAISRAMTPPG